MSNERDPSGNGPTRRPVLRLQVVDSVEEAVVYSLARWLQDDFGRAVTLEPLTAKPGEGEPATATVVVEPDSVSQLSLLISAIVRFLRGRHGDMAIRATVGDAVVELRGDTGAEDRWRIVERLASGIDNSRAAYPSVVTGDAHVFITATEIEDPPAALE